MHVEHMIPSTEDKTITGFGTQLCIYSFFSCPIYIERESACDCRLGCLFVA